MSTSDPDSLPRRKPAAEGFFTRFQLWFHVLILGTMVVLLTPTLLWARDHGGLGMRELALALMILFQAGFYLYRFTRTESTSERTWVFYFAINLAVCLIEARLNRHFGWLAAIYIGQVAGILPLRYSLPACGFVWVVFNPPGLGLLSGGLPVSLNAAMDVLARTTMCGSWLVLGLFVRHLVNVSRERGALIEKLETARRDLEAARRRDAELAVLRERERLARDLHDSLGHSLVTLTVQLEAAQRLIASDPARAAAGLAEMQKLTRSGMEALRRSLADLRAPGLEDRPLAEVLQTLCADVGRRTGLDIRCAAATATDRLPPVVSDVLWRATQEALTNVERHAQARRVDVRLDILPGEVRLSVGDDGAGLPAGAETKPGRYGLRGMRERVEGVGGTLRVEAGQNQGTTLVATVPLIDG